jgi:hypothetical protein
MPQVYIHIVSYRFHDEPRDHRFELAEPVLEQHLAAMHLLQLHFGDAENSLIMPSADSAPDDILQQARLLGITDITCDSVAQF